MGTAMLGGVRGRVLQLISITAGGLLAGVLLLLMTNLNLLTTLAYLLFVAFRLLSGADASFYLKLLAQFQLLVTIGPKKNLAGF